MPTIEVRISAPMMNVSMSLARPVFRRPEPNCSKM
jgi:hypothetical protein